MHRFEAITTEVTVTDADSPSIVLATNVEEAANQTAATKSMWEEQCRDSVVPEFILTDATKWTYVDDVGEAQLKIVTCNVSYKPVSRDADDIASHADAH